MDASDLELNHPSPLRRAAATTAVLAIVAALVAYFGRRNDPTPAP